MLKHIIKIVTIFCLASCVNNGGENSGSTMKEASTKIIGLNSYNNLIATMNDSVSTWKLNRLSRYIEEKDKSEYRIDSLLCLNKEGNRIITCLLGKSFLKPKPTGGITFFYGEKINSKWFFFSGDHIFVPHEMRSVKDGNSFSYEELHLIALKEVYQGYLNSKGEINEEWFIGHFENGGWCSKCKTAEDFKNAKLEGVRNNWASRDTTKPIIQLP